MHRDTRELDNNSLIEGDICIIGAGASGISMALEWNNSPYKVILLEGGGFEYDQKVQESYKGKSTGQKYFPLMSTRLHQFGGTTSLWGGFCSTFDEIDFKKRKWVPHSGWPFEKKELEPFYKKSQKYLELPTNEYDLDFYKKRYPDLYTIPFNKEKVWNKIWQFSPPTRFGTKYKDEIIKSKNIHLYTYAKAVNIIANENLENVEDIIIKTPSGKSHSVRATYFVLACGAVQNARMLLASNSQQSEGLGNHYDNVGRFFMEHLEMLSSAELWFTEQFDLDLYMFTSDTKFRAELAISEELQTKEKILNGTANLRELVSARYNSSRENYNIDQNGNIKSNSFIGKISNKFKSLSDSGIKNINNAYLLGTRIEQAPNPNSRITIGKEVDSYGVPLVNLNWQLSTIDKFSIQQMYRIIGNEIGSLNLGRVKLLDWLQDPNDMSWPESTSGGWHHMGTTRMAEDCSLGVVDSNCKVHGIRNLFIAGSSCFPTAGSVNPLLTSVALTIRLSDHLKFILKKIKTENI